MEKIPEFSESQEKKDNLIQLPPNLATLRNSLKYESSMIDLSPEDVGVFSGSLDSVKLVIGKKYIYISRLDVNDPQFVSSYKIPLQVARLELDANDNVVGVIIDDTKLIGETFALLSSVPFFEKIKTTFSIPNVEVDTAAYKEKLNAIAEEKNKAAKEIFALAPKKRIIREEMGDAAEDKVINVIQGSFSVISKEVPEQYIQTIGAGPCIIIVGYDPTNEMVRLAHMDAFDDIKNVAGYIVGGMKKITVLGGDRSSVARLVELKKYFQDRQIDVAEWDILNDVKSIVVDKKTGKIYNLAKIKSTTKR